MKCAIAGVCLNFACWEPIAVRCGGMHVEQLREVLFWHGFGNDSAERAWHVAAMKLTYICLWSVGPLSCRSNDKCAALRLQLRVACPT